MLFWIRGSGVRMSRLMLSQLKLSFPRINPDVGGERPLRGVAAAERDRSLILSAPDEDYCTI